MRTRIIVLVLALLVVIGLCAWWWQRGAVERRFDGPLLDADWDEVLALAQAPAPQEGDQVIHEWLAVEAYRHLSQPHRAWDPLSRLRDKQSESISNLEPVETWARAFQRRHKDQAVAWELLSSALWWVGKDEEALSAANRAAELAVDDPAAYIARARAQQALGQLDEAIECYSQAIERGPRLARAYFGRAEVWLAKGDADHAIDDLTRAIELNPRYARAYHRRGRAYRAKGDVTGAIAEYDQALELAPRLAEAWLDKAKACEDIGHRQKAAKAYREFIRLAPEVGLEQLVPAAREGLDGLGADD